MPDSATPAPVTVNGFLLPPSVNILKVSAFIINSDGPVTPDKIWNPAMCPPAFKVTPYCEEIPLTELDRVDTLEVKLPTVDVTPDI